MPKTSSVIGASLTMHAFPFFNAVSDSHSNWGSCQITVRLDYAIRGRRGTPGRFLGVMVGSGGGLCAYLLNAYYASIET